MNRSGVRRNQIDCMSLPHDQDIHANACMRRLRNGQWRSMAPLLQHEPGRRALCIGVADENVAPVSPSQTWTRMWMAQGSYCGDVRGRVDEPLPFVDEAFDLVWLQHALEPAPHAAALLAEACRVLAYGGVLAVTALHPVGGWMPWFCWQARGQHQRLQWPLRLRQRLWRSGLDVEYQRRLGAPWPGAAPVAHGDSRWGGGYLLLARKPRRMAIPLKLRPLPVHPPVNVSLSPSARRQASSLLETA